MSDLGDSSAARTRNDRLAAPSPRPASGEASDRDASEDITLDVPGLASRRADLPPGACVGRYITIEKLGAGGMGVVYKAYDPQLSRPVALKLLHRSASAEQLSERMLREAQALARLSHPNVVTVHDVGSFESHVFIAMEFVDGQNLRGWLDAAPRSPRAILDAFLAAGEGLTAAHQAGLVHRDFKPDNVIVGNDGRVRVLDFGLVRAAGEPARETPPPASPPDLISDISSDTSSDRLSAPLTRLGTIMGTPRFMAPEQHQGEATDERADQFSFCVSLYWALYGDLPFSGDTVEEYRRAVLDGQVRELPRNDKRVPARIRAALVRGLAERPSARWSSMAALLAELRKDPAAAWRRAALIMAATAAMAVALVAMGLAIRARRIAAVQARLAHQFGQDVARMDAAARFAQVLPLHDLEPEVREIRARMATIAAEIKDLGGMAKGPGQYALGRGHMALEHWDDALHELDAAWSSGYRSPELAYALGLVHGKLYQRELAALTPSGDPAADEARRKAIERAHRDPALRYLKSTSRDELATPEYGQGLIALYEGRFGDALALADKALARTPSLFEARTLQGDIHLAVAKERKLAGDVDGAMREVVQAGEPYRAAAEVARSSVEVYAGECGRLVELANLEDDKYITPEAAVSAALAACERGLVARPGSPELLLLQAYAWRALAWYQSGRTHDPSTAFEHALAIGEEILRRQPHSIEALLVLCRIYMRLAWFHQGNGGDVVSDLRRAIELGKRALALGATGFDVHYALAKAYALQSYYEMGVGIDPRAAADATIVEAQKALTYAPGNHNVWNDMAIAYVKVGQWQMEHGIDPRQSLERAIAAEETVARRAPTISLGFEGVSDEYLQLGEHLAHIGEDPLAVSGRGAENARKAIALAPNSWFGYNNLAALNGTMARWQLTHHVDPTALITEARQAAKRALAIDGNIRDTYETLADLGVTAARWAMVNGGDPSRSFAAADAAAARAVALSDGKDGYAVAQQANVVRWRAEWLVQRSQPVAGLVRRGLELTAQAIARNAQTVDAFITNAGLELLTAKAARRPDERVAAAERAQAAITRALALNRFRAVELKPLEEEAARLRGTNSATR